MGAIRKVGKVGEVAWYLMQINRIKDAYQIYEQTQSDDALLDAAKEIAGLDE